MDSYFSWLNCPPYSIYGGKLHLALGSVALAFPSVFYAIAKKTATNTNGLQTFHTKKRGNLVFTVRHKKRCCIFYHTERRHSLLNNKEENLFADKVIRAFSCT